MRWHPLNGWMASLNQWTWIWVHVHGDGQGSLACLSSWSHKELDMAEWLNWTELNRQWSNDVQIYKNFREVNIGPTAKLGKNKMIIITCAGDIWGNEDSHAILKGVYVFKGQFGRKYQCKMLISFVSVVLLPEILLKNISIQVMRIKLDHH